VLILALLGGGAWWMDHLAAARDKERALAAERDRHEAAAMLAQAEEVVGAGDLSAADLALTQAEGRIRESSSADLRYRLTVAKRDRDLIRDLREIDDMSWVIGYFSAADPAELARKHRAAFARYGLDPSGADPGAAADAVRASRVSAALVAGLGEWFCTEPASPRLGQLLDRLDPAADRVAIRAAIQSGDEGRVRALVAALDGSNVPTWFAASIGYHRMVPFEDGVRLMTAAWRSHPGSYPLAYRIAQRLWATGNDRLPEMLAWARVAVALRPESPYPHILVTNALRMMRNWGEAEASGRRSVELSRKYPGYAGAYVNLGAVLVEKGDPSGGEATYRAALVIDPRSAVACHGLGLICNARGDLAGAEEWYRKSVALAPADAQLRENLDGYVRMRAVYARLDAVASGRANPATAAEAIELAEGAHRMTRRRYLLAAQLYGRAFDIDPALADDLNATHRYSAAWCAAQAAAGKDDEMTALGVEEWGHLTGLALEWLRADLRLRTSQANDPKLWPEARKALTFWKDDKGLASVRDPAWLAAMPLAERKGWEWLWRDVDAVLASISKQEGPPPP
jgi:tetratricopeptide (TPR) repeat protein